MEIVADAGYQGLGAEVGSPPGFVGVTNVPFPVRETVRPDAELCSLADGTADFRLEAELRL